MFVVGGGDRWGQAQMDNALLPCVRTVLERCRGVMGTGKGALIQPGEEQEGGNREGDE